MKRSILDFAEEFELYKEHVEILMDILDTDDAEEEFENMQLIKAMNTAKDGDYCDDWYAIFDDYE